MPDKKEFERLKRLGYCVTSRKYGMVARIDRADWKEFMAISVRPWSLKEGMTWVNGLDKGDHAEDHYRRCYSKDRLEFSGSLTRLVVKYLPNSGGYRTGYVEK